MDLFYFENITRFVKTTILKRSKPWPSKALQQPIYIIYIQFPNPSESSRPLLFAVYLRMSVSRLFLKMLTFLYLIRSASGTPECMATQVIPRCLPYEQNFDSVST